MGDFPVTRVLNINVNLPDGSKVSCGISFPLPDGKELVQGPFTYHADGLISKHNAAWLNDPRFAEAYRRAMASGHHFGAGLHIEWRVYTACWAAQLAQHLDGDFVECGVHTGIYSSAICSYIDFNRHAAKRFYLLDTFTGFSAEHGASVDAEIAAELNEQYNASDLYDLVCRNFAEYPNAVVVRGAVPETLRLVPSERIAYLCIDMNSVEPERAALEYFWPKVVPGGVVLLDDYGFEGHDEQRRSFDAFAAENGMSILSMPTGHGLVIKAGG